MKYTSHKRGASGLLRSTRGFSLMEIMIALSIITLVVGVSFVGYTLATENGKAGAVVSAVDNAKKAIAQFANEHGGLVPITEATVSTQIPTEGTAFSATATAALAGACTLEPVLLTERAAERAISIGAGPNIAATNPSAADVRWNVATQKFFMSPDAAATRNYAQSNRIECRLSDPATSPHIASGANFYLDGTTSIASGRRVIYIAIPGCPASLAYKISQKIDGANFSSSETTQDTKGAVVYAAPIAGETFVYIYVLDV